MHLSRQSFFNYALFFTITALLIPPRLALSSEEKGLNTWEHLDNIGTEAFNQGDLNKAKDYYSKALIVAESLGENDPRLARSLHNLGFLNYSEGNNAEAEVFFEKTIKLKKQIYGNEHGEVAWSLLALGNAHKELGKFNKGETALNQAIKIYEKRYGLIHPSVAGATYDLGLLYIKQNNYPSAKKAFSKSLSIFEKTYGPEHNEYKKTLVAYKYFFKEAPKVGEDEEIHIKISEVKNEIDAIEAIRSLGISRAITMHDETINILVRKGIVTKQDLLTVIAKYKKP